MNRRVFEGATALLAAPDPDTIIATPDTVTSFGADGVATDTAIDGNSALVTGSSRGLGRAAAIALAREGANVVLNGRDEDRLAAAVEEVDAAGDGRVVGQPGDLTEEADVVRLVERTVDAFGGLDHLVTSAGGPPKGGLFELTADELRYGFDLLVLRLLRLARESADHLAADGGGTIVNIASISAKETFGSLGMGSAVRMPTIGIAKMLARDLGPDVRVNTVLTGLFDDEDEADRAASAPRREEEARTTTRSADYAADIKAYARDHAFLGRNGRPEEMGDVVAFLSSGRSSFVTGAAIPVDGGLTQSNL